MISTRITWTTPVNTLRSGGAKARSAASRAMNTQSQPVLARVKQRTRRRTGALQASERVEVTNGEMTVTAGGGEVDYAYWQEVGTWRMEGTQYIERGLTESAPIVFDSVAREISAEFS